MRTILIAAIACSLAGAHNTLQAQAPTRPNPNQQVAAIGEIRGKVLDAEGKTPIAMASVAVWTKVNPMLVAGAMTRPDGSFRIEGLTPGSYTVKIAMIGYDAHTSAELVIAAGAPRVVAGDIALARSPIKMASIEVNAERAVVIAPDRNSYRARDIA